MFGLRQTLEELTEFKPSYALNMHLKLYKYNVLYLYTMERITNLLERQGLRLEVDIANNAFIIWSRGMQVGYIHCCISKMEVNPSQYNLRSSKFVNRKAIHICDLQVHPDYQHYGIAKLLMTYAITFLLQYHSVKYITVDDVDEQVKSNIYAKYGFDYVEPLYFKDGEYYNSGPEKQVKVDTFLERVPEIKLDYRCNRHTWFW